MKIKLEASTEIIDLTKYTNEKGFGVPPSKYYVKNGKKLECKAEYLFPPYDESKLK